MSVKSESPTRPGGCSWPEDDVLLGPVQRPPGADAPLQGAPNTDADLGMATPDLVENGHRSKAWSAL